MRVYSSGIFNNAQRFPRVTIYFIAAIFLLISIHNPANGATEEQLDSVRFLLLQQNSPPKPPPTPTPTLTPTPMPTLTPTPIATPSPTPTFGPTPPMAPGEGGIFNSGATGSSAGLALGALGGIFLVLRRKDKD